MSISIHPASPADCRGLHQVGSKAFANDMLTVRGLPKDMTPEQTEELIQWRVSRGVRRMESPNNFYYKAIDDETGEIVGGCGWHGPTDLIKDENEGQERYGKVPDFMNQAFYDDLAKTFAEARKDVVGERKDLWFLQALYVHPDHQGKGIGSRMLKRGIEELVDGDGRNLDCYLECSAAPAARAVYLRTGFEHIANIEALDGEYVMSAMLRKGTSKA